MPLTRPLIEHAIGTVPLAYLHAEAALRKPEIEAKLGHPVSWYAVFKDAERVARWRVYRAGLAQQARSLAVRRILLLS